MHSFLSHLLPSIHDPLIRTLSLHTILYQLLWNYFPSCAFFKSESWNIKWAKTSCECSFMAFIFHFHSLFFCTFPCCCISRHHHRSNIMLMMKKKVSIFNDCIKTLSFFSLLSFTHFSELSEICSLRWRRRFMGKDISLIVSLDFLSIHKEMLTKVTLKVLAFIR
jgi:hypothetical protein